MSTPGETKPDPKTQAYLDRVLKAVKGPAPRKTIPPSKLKPGGKK